MGRLGKYGRCGLVLSWYIAFLIYNLFEDDN